MANENIFRFIRIAEAFEKPEGVQVAFYQGDQLKQILWPSNTPIPQRGDVFEETALGWQKISSAQDDGWSSRDALRWRKPIHPNGPSRMDVLKKRAVIRSALRHSLDEDGFIEMDSPLLVHGTTPDIAVESFALGNRYLTTSTEYQMKRLVVGGFEKIYSLTQNFRFGDSDTAWRNPEFTMLEWGRVGGTMRNVERDAENFTLAALDKLGRGLSLTYQGTPLCFNAPWARLPVGEAIERYTGVSVPDFEATSCRRAADAVGMPYRPEWAEDKHFLFSLLMDFLQPRFGTDAPVFLCDWPLYQTISASSKDELRVDRSELFVAGLELADGFSGLDDVAKQRQLFDYASGLRESNGQKPVQYDARYLQAMADGAPYGAGMALGFDRLVMLLTDQDQIRNVLAFAWDEV